MSSEPPCKNGNVRLTTVPLKAGQVRIRYQSLYLENRFFTIVVTCAFYCTKTYWNYQNFERQYLSNKDFLGTVLSWVAIFS